MITGNSDFILIGKIMETNSVYVSNQMETQIFSALALKQLTSKKLYYTIQNVTFSGLLSCLESRISPKEKADSTGRRSSLEDSQMKDTGVSQTAEYQL